MARIVICPNREDEHAPFPHYIMVNADGTPLITSAGKPIIVCTICEHMTSRMVTGCDCPEKCHELWILENP